jgi:hypothetical protein
MIIELRYIAELEHETALAEVPEVPRLEKPEAFQGSDRGGT